MKFESSKGHNLVHSGEWFHLKCSPKLKSFNDNDMKTWLIDNDMVDYHQHDPSIQLCLHRPRSSPNVKSHLLAWYLLGTYLVDYPSIPKGRALKLTLKLKVVTGSVGPTATCVGADCRHNFVWLIIPWTCHGWTIEIWDFMLPYWNMLDLRLACNRWLIIVHDNDYYRLDGRRLWSRSR